MRLSPGEITGRLAGLRALHLQTDRDRDLRAQLDRLLQVDAEGVQTAVPVRFTADLETRGIAIIEAPGGGKALREANVEPILPRSKLNKLVYRRTDL